MRCRSSSKAATTQGGNNQDGNSQGGQGGNSQGNGNGNFRLIVAEKPERKRRAGSGVPFPLLGISGVKVYHVAFLQLIMEIW
jgi:hypothetical protein